MIGLASLFSSTRAGQGDEATSSLSELPRFVSSGPLSPHLSRTATPPSTSHLSLHFFVATASLGMRTRPQKEKPLSFLHHLPSPLPFFLLPLSLTFLSTLKRLWVSHWDDTERKMDGGPSASKASPETAPLTSIICSPVAHSRLLALALCHGFRRARREGWHPLQLEHLALVADRGHSQSVVVRSRCLRSSRSTS